MWKKIKTSRKLWTALLLMFVATIMTFVMENVVFNDWADMIKWLFAIYAGANVGEHASNALNKNGKESSG